MSFQYFSGEVRGLRGPGLTSEQQAQLDTAIAVSDVALQRQGVDVEGTGFVDTRQSQLKNLRAGEAPFDAVRMDQLTAAKGRIDAVAAQAIGLNYQAAVQYSPTPNYLQPGATSQSWSYSSPDGGFGAIGITIEPKGAGSVIRAIIELSNRVGAVPTVALWNQALNGGNGARLPGTSQPILDGLDLYEFVVPAGHTATAIEFETNSDGTANGGNVFAIVNGGSERSLAAIVDDIENAVAAIEPLAEKWTDADKAIFWPTPVAFVAGRKNTLYGRQMVRKRARQSQLDVHLISSAENLAAPGLSLFLAPQASFNTDEIVNAACQIEVKDEAVADIIWEKGFTARVASATQAGDIPTCILGDSTAALGRNALVSQVAATGANFVGIGTLPLAGSEKYEGRPSWSAMDYMGRTRPASYPNPFLRSLSVSIPAELAIIQANPTKCFADDGSFGTGVRPSYAQDNSRASYSLFSWVYWRTNAAVALTGTEKLRVIFQLGRNGTNLEAWIADNELAQKHIVNDFLAAFPNGTMIVSSEALGDGTDINNGVQRSTGYSEFTAALIAKKIAWFSNRESQRVWLAPAWAMMDAYGAFDLDVASATDADTGTQRRPIRDVVHYTSQRKAQWASAVAAPLLYVHQTT